MGGPNFPNIEDCSAEVDPCNVRCLISDNNSVKVKSKQEIN